jgi:hypothetical protein
MILMRCANDIVVGVEHDAEARRFWDEEFSLSVNPDKTRLIDFGRTNELIAGSESRRPSTSWRYLHL